METQAPCAVAAKALPTPSVGSVPGLAGALVALLGRRGGGGLGGFEGLEAAFRDAGLGAAFASWVAIGPNQPVGPADVARALGPALTSMAAATRTDPDRLALALADLLPRVIDGLTPDGQRPSGGRVATLWALARSWLARPRRAA